MDESALVRAHALGLDEGIIGPHEQTSGEQAVTPALIEKHGSRMNLGEIQLFAASWRGIGIPALANTQHIQETDRKTAA